MDNIPQQIRRQGVIKTRLLRPRSFPLANEYSVPQTGKAGAFLIGLIGEAR
jgi:hypothetical protein